MLSNFIKFNLSLLLLSVAGFTFAQNSNDIIFDKTVQKFKKVDEGHQINLTYKFKYNGKTQLQLIPPKVDCECTTVDIPEGNIYPNKEYSIIVHFNTKDKIGFQERPIKLNFLSTSNKDLNIEKTIIFKGVVKASKGTKAKYRSNN